jgi:hypothetical protein
MAAFFVLRWWKDGRGVVPSSSSHQQSSIVYPLLTARWLNRFDLRVTIFDI